MFDRDAIRAILHGDTEALKRLNKKAKHFFGKSCPECGSHEIEDNGQSGHGLAFRCIDCENQWDADQYS